MDQRGRGRARYAVMAGLLMLLPPLWPGAARAQISDGVVKIGLLLDLSGPYSALTGQGSAAAASMAIADFGTKVAGAPIALVVADHHNNTDRAGDIARDWFEHQQVDAILEVTGSSEALIVQRIGANRDRIVSVSAAGADRLSNQGCTPTSMQYVYDTYSIAHTIGTALVRRGAENWFFITVDYSFGYDLENDTAEVVRASGGKVLGHARHPLDAPDFTSYLAQAQQSKAKVIGLANGGADLARSIEQAAQRGMIPGPQTFAGLALRINGVDELGLKLTQGMTLSESFYWDTNDETRVWSKRFYAVANKMPNSLQAGLYSSVTHYLKAIGKTGTDAAGPVMAAMRATPVDDFFAHNGHIRADGLMVHDTNLFQVKTPAESRYAWDYFNPIATIPADQAFLPLAQSQCPLVRP